jgi:hypothetical protein
MYLNKQGFMIWTGFISSGQSSVAVSCEHRNEPYCSVKDEELGPTHLGLTDLHQQV